ncbi:MAG TPA: MoaD/ThiS family protein [candidate division Zixibacteria bacterium]|jgi:molybdopterin converting factor small subunit
MITIRLPRQLWEYADGAQEITVEEGSLRESFAALKALHPRAYERIFTEPGELRVHVNVFVNKRLVRVLEVANVRLTDGDIVTVMPAISGG